MSRTRWLILLIVLGIALVAILLYLAYCRGPTEPRTGAFVTDAGGRPIDRLEAGSSLHAGAHELAPRTPHEFRLTLDGELVSFARLASDADGTIPPFVLWYQSGVVGCSQRIDPQAELPPFTFRTFDESEEALAGRRLRLTVHSLAGEDVGGPLLTERRASPVSTLELPVMARRHPMVYPSTEDGCLINSRPVRGETLYVTGRNFAPGEELLVAVVRNQRSWRVGDPIDDVTGTRGAPAPVRVQADDEGRFTVTVWESPLQRRGTYDLIAHRLEAETEAPWQVRRDDVVSFLSETGFILYLLYPVGGPLMDIAGRPVSGTPYFQFADSFAVDDDTVWGAVDPTYVPPGHTGGKYASYYVVQHRDVDGWDPTAGGATNLVDVTGTIEVMPVKAGCVNGTDIPIWAPPLTLGDYDVVVDFGPSPAETEPDYSTDANYDDAVDFLDGASQVGFVVAPDPYTVGSIPVGRASYSQDDYFATLGGASDVDLRAVVRYPATAAGDETPVAAGQHPLFVIEHGNHKSCEVGDCWPPDHAGCPDRTPNHEGYMQLLEILASHGVIAVSIDAYDLTGCVPSWIEERGDLILKHLELWSHLDDPTTFATYPDFFSGLFNDHVDLSRISVSGHSRGGEASVAAYMQNTTFTIGSVSSIAPVDVLGLTLPDVPYFVLLPAADGDVSSLKGVKIYDRAGSGLAPVDATTKSGTYIYGANHNFFNTVWADDGDDSDPGRDDYIPAADQQRLGEAYLAAFTRVHLLGETVYEDMLRGRLIFPSTAGFKIFPIRHETSHTRLEDGSGAGASPSGLTATATLGPSVHVTEALAIEWNSPGAELSYTVPLADRDVSSFEVLSFRVTQTNSTLNPASDDQDFRVELVGGGNTKATYVSSFDRIPKPYDHPYYLSDHTLMTTVRIPLHSFIINNSGVTLDDIDTVRFVFSDPIEGEIYVDDIEFSR